MTASGYCKLAGFRTLTQAASWIGVSARTLNNWFEDDIDKFQRFVDRASIEAGIQERKDGIAEAHLQLGVVR